MQKKKPAKKPQPKLSPASAAKIRVKAAKAMKGYNGAAGAAY
jgi:hypothetical protein